MSVPCIYGCHTYHTERMQQNRTCHKSQLASLNVWDWETLGEVLFSRIVQEANSAVARWRFLELDRIALLECSVTGGHGLPAEVAHSVYSSRQARKSIDGVPIIVLH